MQKKLRNEIFIFDYLIGTLKNISIICFETRKELVFFRKDDGNVIE